MTKESKKKSGNTKELWKEDELLGIKIEYSQRGFLRLKGEKRTKPKKLVIKGDPHYAIKENKTLKNLLDLIDYLQRNRVAINRCSVRLLCEIVTRYLNLKKVRRVNPSTGKVTYNYSQKAYNLAYALWYIGMKARI